MPDNNRKNSYRIKSMTAFARVESETALASFTWELRSVNHRYLETSFKLPEQFRQIEMALRERLRKKLARGKVDVHLQFARKESEQSIAVNPERVAQLSAALQEVSELAGIESQPSALQILSWPGVTAQQELDFEQLKPALLQAFEQTVDQLIEVRTNEGEKLAAMVDERLEKIAVLVDHVEKLIPDILSAQHQKLSTRLAELDLEVDAERLAQEAVLFAQKIDVAEEIDRLRAHLEEVASSLQSNKPCGRRLDFLMQELNREANTLASKSAQVDTSQAAVDLKVLIEQIREQVQNIE